MKSQTSSLLKCLILSLSLLIWRGGGAKAEVEDGITHIKTIKASVPDNNTNEEKKLLVNWV